MHVTTGVGRLRRAGGFLMALGAGLLVGILHPLALAEEGSAETVGLWQRWETRFEAAEPADSETLVAVELTSPSGERQRVEGFWDGGRVWRVRFMPDELGRWTYQTSSDPAREGLDDQSGEFQCVENDGATALLEHGPVGVSDDGRYLAHADGTPFFWLADTAWNGALLSKADDWETYLEDRKSKRFTAIQFVTTQWRTAYTNAEGQRAYTGREQIEIQPEFFRRMDERVDQVNAQGLLAAPVLLWALGDVEYTPGKLPTDQAVRLARYLVARYGGNHVLWFLGGDENYSGNREQHWKKIGREVFGSGSHAPVTLHPQGMQWHFDAFRDEEWLDVLIYQSGHGDSPETLAWIHSGPPARKWKEEPMRPIINSEPPYEDHVAYQSREPHTDYSVRRAVYWSLLNAPTAGVSYGAHGVWSWQEEPGVPLNHEGSGEAKPWHEAMELPGSTQMKHMAELFTSGPWWRLRPDPEMVESQPAQRDPAKSIAASRTDNGAFALFYLPRGASRLVVDPAPLHDEAQASWFDPRTGEEREAEPSPSNEYRPPDEQDWVLVMRRGN